MAQANVEVVTAASEAFNRGDLVGAEIGSVRTRNLLSSLRRFSTSVRESSFSSCARTVLRTTIYPHIDDARAAAEHLAESGGS
jgi:hypothetical protein